MFWKSKNEWEDDFENSNSKKKVALFSGAAITTICLIVVAVIGIKCAYRIGPGFAGVIYNMDGGVEDDTLGQGWHIVSPWKSVIEYPVSTETVYYTKNNVDGEDKDKKDDNSINVNTKDGKQVNCDVTYAYHMNQDTLPELFTQFRGRKYTDIESSIMKNDMYQAVNEVTSQYTLMELVGDKRPQINAEIFKKFFEALDREGIVLETFNLSDVRPDDATKEAIQNVVNAQNALAQSKIDKEKAEIEAEQARVTAKGKADALIIEAEGQAQANEKLQQTLTSTVIQQHMIEKWDGKLSQFNGGGNSSFLFNVSQ